MDILVVVDGWVEAEVGIMIIIKAGANIALLMAPHYQSLLELFISTKSSVEQTLGVCDHDHDDDDHKETAEDGHFAFIFCVHVR